MTDTLTQEQRKKIAEEARATCESCDSPCSYCDVLLNKVIDLTLASLTNPPMFAPRGRKG